MAQKIQLNIIPFTPIEQKLSFAFYPDKQKGMAPIHWSKLFDEFPEDQEKDKQFYYADFQPAVDGAIEKEIELTGVIYTAI